MAELFTGKEKFHASVCGNKRQYTTRKEAKQQAKRYNQRFEKQEPYLCPICRMYHLTKVKNGKAKAHA